MNTKIEVLRCSSAILLLIALVFVFSSALMSQPALEYGKGVEPISVAGRYLQTFKSVVVERLTFDDAVGWVEQIVSYAGAELELYPMAEVGEEGRLFYYSDNDPSAVFDIDLSTGDFLFNKGLAAYKEEGNTPNLVPSEEAPSIAVHHLGKLELLPPEDELVLAHVGGLNMAVYHSDGTTNDYKKLVTVRFERELAGLPVHGASRIVVHLGEDSSLVGLVWSWTKVEGRGLTQDELRSDAEIQGELEKRLLTGAMDASEALVEESTLVLYDDGQGVIEPAIYVQALLRYKAETELAGGETATGTYEVPYDFYVPVLEAYAAVYPFVRDAEVLPEKDSS